MSISPSGRSGSRAASGNRADHPRDDELMGPGTDGRPRLGCRSGTRSPVSTPGGTKSVGCFLRSFVQQMIDLAPESKGIPLEVNRVRAARRVPEPCADLPVVVATRMSLSFPVLLGAVPLYAVDFGLKENAGRIEAPHVQNAAGFPTAASAATCPSISSMPRCPPGRRLRST